MDGLNRYMEGAEAVDRVPSVLLMAEQAVSLVLSGAFVATKTKTSTMHRIFIVGNRM